MLYAVPFGDLENDTIVGPAAGSTLAKIRNEGSLNYGVVVPDRFEGNATESDKLVGMGAEYCRALASALLHDDPTDICLSSLFLDQKSSLIVHSPMEKWTYLFDTESNGSLILKDLHH